MLVNDPQPKLKFENYVMKSVAVIKVSIGVKRVELIGLHQDHGERLRTRSKVKTCNFITVSNCECDKLHGRSNEG